MAGNYLTGGPAHYAAVPVLPASLTTPAAAAAYTPLPAAGLVYTLITSTLLTSRLDIRCQQDEH